MKTIKELIKAHKPHQPVCYININEHLKSHTKKWLMYVLRKQFDVQIECEYSMSDPGAMTISVPVSEVRTDEQKQEFIDTIDMSLWYISFDYGVEDGRWNVMIEPIHAKDVSKEVLSHPYIFHISSSSRISKFGKDGRFVQDTIKNVGMRTRNQSTYRKFTKRTYFFCPGDKQDLHDMMFELVKDLGIPLKDPKLYRISTENLNNITFYHDSVYDNEGFVYAFINIPWSEMEEIKLS